MALVLKPVLSPSNHLDLLAAARGKCVRQARELVAERFPKADAPSSIRKLPERTSNRAEAGSLAPSSAAAAPLPAVAPPTLANPLSKPDLPAAPPPMRAPPMPAPPAPSPAMTISVAAEPSTERSEFTLSSPTAEWQERSSAPRASSAPPVARSVIEPLSAQRYRIQFTADASLKQRLELARNLLRHAHPSGDFGQIISRALALLIDDLMRRRFGAGARRKAVSAAGEKPANMPSATAASAVDASPSASEKAPHTPASKLPNPARSAATVASNAPTDRSSHIPRGARRAVLERDGLSCSWMDAHGVRCGSQAWLEVDHRQPAGKGGSSEPDNLRLLCRSHNRLAAERAYGREHIERCARREKAERAPPPPRT